MKTKNQIQKEALAALKGLRKGGIEVSMGVGKTLLGLKHMAVNYTDISKFLVVAPRKKIFQSWTDDMNKFDYAHLDEHVTFSTYLSLKKQVFDYDVIYFDSVSHRYNIIFPALDLLPLLRLRAQLWPLLVVVVLICS